MISRFPSRRKTEPVRVNDDYHPIPTTRFVDTSPSYANITLSDVFPEGEIDMSTYVKNLQYIQTKEGGDSTISGYKIYELRSCKEKTRSNHEYILASVRTSKGSPPRYLRFDRCAGETPKKSNHFSTYSEAILKSLGVGGCVRTVSQPNENNADLIEILGFDSVLNLRPLALCDLTLLASTVGLYASWDQKLRGQCSWFTAVVFEVLKSIYDYTEEVGGGRSRNKILNFFLHRDQYRGPEDYEVREIRTMFVEDLARFNEGQLREERLPIVQGQGGRNARSKWPLGPRSKWPFRSRTYAGNETRFEEQGVR